MPATYMVRYIFDKPVVILNKGTDRAFRTTTVDFFGSSLEEVDSVDIKKCEFIEHLKAKFYLRTVYKRNDEFSMWYSVKTDRVYT